MVKSELIEKIAEQNPHLYQRDVETIVNAILGTITNALARTRWRAATGSSCAASAPLR